VDIGTGDVTRLTPPPAANEGTWAGAAAAAAAAVPGGAAPEGGGGSWTLLDVCDGVVAAASSTPTSPPRVHVAWVGGRGLHSSTSQLNVSAFCRIGGAFSSFLGGVFRRSFGVFGYGGFRVYFVSETAKVELRSGRV